MTKNEVIKKLQGSIFTVLSEKRIQNAIQLKLNSASYINVFDNGNVVAQGVYHLRLEKLLGLAQPAYNQSTSSTIQTALKKVLVAGHNQDYILDLYRKLDAWKIEANYLHMEELLGNGSTIIERLDENLGDLSCSIVVATTDQIGMIDNQDVLFELGLLLGKFGRDNVIILLKNNGSLKLPLNYTGLRSLQFKNSIEECANQLATELQRFGYTCP